MRLAHDRRHVMFAMRMKRDVAQQNDFVITADLLESALEIGFGAFFIALEIFEEGVDDALRRVDEPFAFRVVADPAKQLLDRRHGAAALFFCPLARIAHYRLSIGTTSRCATPI